MNRRPFLTSLAGLCSVLGSGCLSSSPREYTTEGDDANPIDAEPADLLLESEELPGDDWNLDKEEDFGTEVRRYFRRDDEWIGVGIHIFESVEDAKDSMDSDREYHKQAEHDIEPHHVGSDGFVRTDRYPIVVFRDANVEGFATHRNVAEGDDDEEIAFRTAVELHEKWR